MNRPNIVDPMATEKPVSKLIVKENKIESNLMASSCKIHKKLIGRRNMSILKRKKNTESLGI